MFPLTVKYTREINLTKRDDAKRYIEYIVQELKKLEVSNIKVNDNRIEFDTSFFKSRNHPMGAADYGYLEIDIYAQIMIYSYSTIRMFIITLLMACGLGTVAFINAGFWFFGIIAFLWIYGMNWFITYFRQRSIFKKMVDGWKM